jgi:hypothetical protein
MNNELADELKPHFLNPKTNAGSSSATTLLYLRRFDLPSVTVKTDSVKEKVLFATTPTLVAKEFPAMPRIPCVLLDIVVFKYDNEKVLPDYDHLFKMIAGVLHSSLQVAALQVLKRHLDEVHVCLGQMIEWAVFEPAQTVSLLNRLFELNIALPNIGQKITGKITENDLGGDFPKNSACMNCFKPFSSHSRPPKASSGLGSHAPTPFGSTNCYPAQNRGSQAPSPFVFTNSFPVQNRGGGFQSGSQSNSTNYNFGSQIPSTNDVSSYCCPVVSVDTGSAQTGRFFKGEAIELMAANQSFGDISHVYNTHSRRDEEVLENFLAFVKKSQEPSTSDLDHLIDSTVKAKHIKQKWLDTRESKFVDKLDFLASIHSYLVARKPSIVFAVTKENANNISRHLTSHGCVCSIIHANTLPEDRDLATQSCHRGELHVLIVTDSSSSVDMGLENVTMVVNFEMPILSNGNADYETYLKRIGNTGRGGRKGIVISLVDDDPSVEIVVAVESLIAKQGQTVIQKLDPENLFDFIAVNIQPP